MSRFFITPDASADLDDIDAYLDSVPFAPAKRISKEIFETILAVADAPFLGTAHSSLTLLFGREVRSRPVHPYRIFYTVAGPTPEIIAILHGARDQHAILSKRAF